jgi:hypothetical protein
MAVMSGASCKFDAGRPSPLTRSFTVSQAPGPKGNINADRRLFFEAGNRDTLDTLCYGVFALGLSVDPDVLFRTKRFSRLSITHLQRPLESAQNSFGPIDRFGIGGSAGAAASTLLAIESSSLGGFGSHIGPIDKCHKRNGAI